MKTRRRIRKTVTAILIAKSTIGIVPNKYAQQHKECRELGINREVSFKNIDQLWKQN